MAGIFLFSAVAGSCANQQILESANTNGGNNRGSSTAVNGQIHQSGLERDLDSLRDADFKFIYVFRRKDGGVIDGEDRRVMNENTPPVINRRLLSDNDPAIIAGSNYRFPPESMKALSERFTVEDHSRPIGESVPQAANTKANQ